MGVTTYNYSHNHINISALNLGSVADIVRIREENIDEPFSSEERGRVRLIEGRIMLADLSRLNRSSSFEGVPIETKRVRVATPLEDKVVTYKAFERLLWDGCNTLDEIVNKIRGIDDISTK